MKGTLLFIFFCITNLSISARSDETFIDQVLKRYTLRESPGVAALLIQNDKVLHSKGYGYANIATKTPIDSSTNFFLASVSKQFTGMAVAKLIDAGLIKSSDLASEYVPELPSYAHGITISQMLHHTSGLIDYLNDTPSVCSRLNENFDLVTYLSKERLLFTPGTEFRYSNTAYALLATVVERVTNIAFPDFLNKYIFGPVGLKDTQIHSPEHEVITNSAIGYKGASPHYLGLNLEHCGNIYGDRGIYSSLDDYKKWIWALEHDRTLPQVLLGDYSPMHNIGHTIVNYGYGWRGGSFKDHDIVWHAGGWDGARNIVFFVPDMDLWLVLFSNDNNFPVDWETDHTIDPYVILSHYVPWAIKTGL